MISHRILVFVVLTTLARAETPPARYQVRDGAFRDVRTGVAFRPRGFNYIRLHGGHGTFDPEFYDGAAADRLFVGLSRDGFNSVRVFINGHAHVPGSVAGEFGAFKSRFPAPESAADWMSRLPALFGGNGFSGWLYWTHDTHEQDAELWHACAADGLIYRSLRACPP